MNRVMILGGGHQGLSMAAHLSLNNVKCCLWNRTPSNIKEVLDTKEILCSGVIQGKAQIDQVITQLSEIKEKLIMVTTPSSAHRDIAKMIAPYVDESHIIVLNPGRTFGILEFEKTLKEYGCTSMPLIAEAQTIVYTCRRLGKNSVAIYAFKHDVKIATMDMEDVTKVINSMPDCLKNYFVPAKSYVETSIGNVGMVLHCAPVLMNIGWIEHEDVEFKYYYEGISKSIAKVLERLDEERINVSKAMGQPVESLAEWLVRTYNTNGTTLYECLQNNQYYKSIDAPLTIHHRYIEEDVPTGLVPLESAGQAYGVATPVTTMIIDLANIVMDKDYRRTGRKYLD